MWFFRLYLLAGQNAIGMGDIRHIPAATAMISVFRRHDGVTVMFM